MKPGNTSRNKPTGCSRASWQPLRSRCVSLKRMDSPVPLGEFLFLTLVFLLQMIDRICVKVQDHLNSLRNSETDAILEDVRAAENLIKDARNSKTVGSERVAARHRTVLHFKNESDNLSLNRVPTSCIHPAAPQPLPPGFGRQGGGELLICGAHSGETGVHGWRGDHRHGPATAGEKIGTSRLGRHQYYCFYKMSRIWVRFSTHRH